MMSGTRSKSAEDEVAIEAHVRGLFKAYLDADEEAIRRGHTRDWCGFPINADRVVRGIDEYMEHARQSLERFRGTAYEINEFDVDVIGDVGIVYYTATWHFRDATGVECVLPLRALDVYRRTEEGWNQAGSNISVIPDSASAKNDPASNRGSGGP